jgi:hypothetical protein
VKSAEPIERLSYDFLMLAGGTEISDDGQHPSSGIDRRDIAHKPFKAYLCDVDSYDVRASGT